MIEIKWFMIMLAAMFVSMFGMLAVTGYAEERTKQTCIASGFELKGGDCVRKP